MEFCVSTRRSKKPRANKPVLVKTFCSIDNKKRRNNSTNDSQSSEETSSKIRCYTAQSNLGLFFAVRESVQQKK